MTDGDSSKLRARLLQYPGITEDNVDQHLLAYEERSSLKESLLRDNGMSNAMAEMFLDRKGYPRPPGWKSVLFYPGGVMPRFGFILMLAIAFAIYFFVFA